ncbi:ribosomal protein L4 domain-containing protein [Suillus cothurnatus]|nr:ribosomal protein L4 domain-containing protein [Suillus cothurnatus]
MLTVSLGSLSHIEASTSLPAVLTAPHVKFNQNKRRFATVSTLAASALLSLVLARGLHIEQIAEVPLVVENAAESFKKTKEVIALPQALNAYSDVTKEDSIIVQAFCNLPGIELVNVQRLNLLQLAPGGHTGRFVNCIEGAFSLLDEVFGTFHKASSYKRYLCAPLPTTKISNPDVPGFRSPWTQKKNPLINKDVLFRMNPYAKTLRRQEFVREGGCQAQKDKKGKMTKSSSVGEAFVNTCTSDQFQTSFHSIPIWSSRISTSNRVMVQPNLLLKWFFSLQLQTKTILHDEYCASCRLEFTCDPFENFSAIASLLLFAIKTASDGGSLKTHLNCDLSSPWPNETTFRSLFEGPQREDELGCKKAEKWESETQYYAPVTSFTLDAPQMAGTVGIDSTRL